MLVLWGEPSQRRVIFASLGRVAQGRVAHNFTDPASAQRAYKLAVSLLKERKGEIRVDTLPEETVKPVVSEATRRQAAAPHPSAAAPHPSA